MLSKATFNWERLLGISLLIQHILKSMSPLGVFPPVHLYILVLLCQLQDKLGNICAIISKLNVTETFWMQLCGLFMKHTGTIRTLELSVEEIFIATFQVQAYLFKSALEVCVSLQKLTCYKLQVCCKGEDIQFQRPREKMVYLSFRKKK